MKVVIVVKLFFIDKYSMNLMEIHYIFKNRESRKKVYLFFTGFIEQDQPIKILDERV